MKIIIPGMVAHWCCCWLAQPRCSPLSASHHFFELICHFNIHFQLDYWMGFIGLRYNPIKSLPRFDFHLRAHPSSNPGNPRVRFHKFFVLGVSVYCRKQYLYNFIYLEFGRVSVIRKVIGQADEEIARITLGEAGEGMYKRPCLLRNTSVRGSTLQ